MRNHKTAISLTLIGLFGSLLAPLAWLLGIPWQEAATAGELLATIYHSFGIDPLSIVYMDRSNVLLGWCHLRRDFRVFRLDRMQDMSVTDQSFRPNRVPMLREVLAQIRAKRDAQERDEDA